ncbi:MAG: porphobilinogen synthase [Candidatus Omnitrophota bacterium]
MGFPATRLRRLRGKEPLRRLVRETRLSIDQLIMPLFAVEGKGVRSPIPSLEGQYHFSVDTLVQEAEEVRRLGIPAILLFGIPGRKDSRATGAYAKDGIVQRAVQAVKETCHDLLVITDVCLCAYTSHGHCGIVEEGGGDEFRIHNDATLEVLSEIALSHAEAGSDMVAPSDMMDGRVGIIRKRLDEHGYSHIPILSYAGKYCSSLYGPFREAARSAPQFGDRSTYQLDPANREQALREMRFDLEEGADILMVKPALPNLDVIYCAKQEFRVPIAAYSVSGEYLMIKAGAKTGFLDENRLKMEILTAIRRAGADILITYFAKEIARLLQEKNATYESIQNFSLEK